MAVVDILRDRERGIPRYNQARRQYGLKPAATFEDLSDNKQACHRVTYYMIFTETHTHTHTYIYNIFTASCQPSLHVP